MSDIQQLQSLILGDRNTFIFLQEEKQPIPVTKKRVTKFLINLAKAGYIIDNSYLLFYLDLPSLKRLQKELIKVIENTTKEGMIFRKSFGESEELTDYTEEEWGAILAQYSITYGWVDKYEQFLGKSPVTVLSNYTESLPEEITSLNNKTKVISLGFKPDLVKLLIDIMNSPIVLRNQQLKTLESAPIDCLEAAAKDSDIVIKETLVKVMSLLSSKRLDFPLLKTATDILRFVVATQAHTPLEGKLTKADLKNVKLRIPSSVRKSLLRNLELIGERSQVYFKDGFSSTLRVQEKEVLIGSKFLCEDMFTYSPFWKTLDKYLRHEKASKCRTKYPIYTKAIDLLYENDRSWTFNGRYSKAKEDLDYALAIEIASERPGFLFRNLLEFLRMVKGVSLPVKESSVSNAFQDKLSKALSREDKIVKTDASTFLRSDGFTDLLQKSINPKLAWQFLEQLKDVRLYSPIYSRTVQGITVRYTVPIPPIDSNLALVVKRQILKALKSKLRDRNKDLGKIFIDTDSKNYALQYSGRSSTELSFSGEFLSKGSILSLEEVAKSKEIALDNVVLRVGVMWRGISGNCSIDLDHNVTIEQQDVYYGSPTLQNNGDIIATSSGDITTSGGQDSRFSTELVDIDLRAMTENGLRELYNSVIAYYSERSIGEFETYFFFYLLDKSDRKLGTDIDVDLSKVDYAIRIDPDNNDKAGSYLGVYFNLEEKVIKVLAAPVKTSLGSYSNVKSNKLYLEKAIKSIENNLTINYALKKAFKKEQVIATTEDASIIISRKDIPIQEGQTLLHPGRDMEKINKFIL